MSVNFTDKEQNSISLMNVSYYGSKAEYMKSCTPDDVVYTDEEAAADFSDLMDSGFIREITCGTYNGATDDFTPWELTDDNIVETVWQALNDDEFIFDMVVNRDIIQEDWTNADYIREYTEVYEVFIVGGRVYVNQD